MNPQSPTDPLEAYRKLFANVQGAPIAPGALPTAPGMAELAAALQAAKAAKAKEPPRHLRNLAPGARDHGSISSVGKLEPPAWTSEK